NLSWTVRLAVAAVGFLLAAPAWGFVPTSDGPSLWGAHRLVAQTEELPGGDVAAYARGKSARPAAGDRLPGLKPAMEQAERGWFARTADQAAEEADALLPTDPREATERLRQLDASLQAHQPGYSQVRDTLKAARTRALLAQLKVGLGEM